MMKFLNSLNEAGKATFILRNRVAVMPFGGRVIGLFPKAGLNALWTHPDLEHPETCRAFFAGAGWLNSGGDRSWISPEVDTNIGDPQRSRETYDVPTAIDPGCYKVTHTGDCAMTLESEMDVLFLRCREKVNLRLTKEISLVDNPPCEIDGVLSWAGYALKSTLQTDRLISSRVRPGLWNLLQVPGGGKFIVPVREGTQPRTFFGAPVCTQEAGCITCKVATAESFKFALRASDSKGLMLYIHDTVPEPFMVIRSFAVHEERRYADVPCDDFADTGYMHQFYVDDGKLGGFGEMEYHTPALGAETGNRFTDTCTTWAMAGTPEQLLRLAERLLHQHDRSMKVCRPFGTNE